MAAVTPSAVPCALVVFSLLFTSAGGKTVSAEPGQTITLDCKAPDKPVTVVEWSRSDLDAEYVLLYRDKQLDPDLQHPSYEGRVHLRDRQMKDGDVSLVLNNLKNADSGTYECRVIQTGRTRGKRAVLETKPVCSFILDVVPPAGRGPGDEEDKEDKKDEGQSTIGLIVGLSVVGLVLVVLLGTFLNKKTHKKPEGDQGSNGDQL